VINPRIISSEIIKKEVRQWVEKPVVPSHGQGSKELLISRGVIVMADHGDSLAVLLKGNMCFVGTMLSLKEGRLRKQQQFL
jgi:hypothetical protein